MNDVKQLNSKHIDSVFKVNAISNNRTYIHSNANLLNETLDSDITKFTDLLAIPKWSIEDFIKERLRYRSFGSEANELSIYSDNALFFYKLFFNFDTGYGLLGSTIFSDGNNTITKEDTTAWQYLTNNMNSDRFSKEYKSVLENKRTSLEKFCKILNYICTECPWYFKDISGLDTAIKLNINGGNIVNEDKKIDISFNKDAIDMRLSTLFDLYKDACYDYRNFREVIPENLRKFDMCIIMFNGPIVGLNISDIPLIENDIQSVEDERYGKNIHYGALKPGLTKNNNKGRYNINNISYKCLILKNCEFDVDSLLSLPNELSNENGFYFEPKVSIKFDRSYIYTLNNELNIEILDNLYKSSNDD